MYIKYYLYKLILVAMLIAGSLWSFGFTEDIEGFGGVGMEISKIEDYIQVHGILPDTPAARSGLKPGDRITQINGEPVASMDMNEAVSKIRGKAGTQVNLDVKRSTDNGDMEELNVSVNREFILQPQLQVNTTLANPTTLTRPDKPVKPLVVYPTLYFIPLTNRILPGSIFPLTLYLNNPQGIPCDEINLWVKYDPEAVKFISGPADTHIQLEDKLLKNWILIQDKSVDSTGDFILKMKSRNNSGYLSGALGTLYFQATGKIPVSRIGFEFPAPDKPGGTCFTLRGKDILGTQNDPTDGTIGASIRILHKAYNSSLNHSE